MSTRALTDPRGELARRDLRYFVELFWPVVCPGVDLAPGPHIDLVCAHLQALADGTCRRLLINIPPRHGKSLITAVLFPAWLWTSRPQARLMFVSYAHQLAVRDSRQCRELIDSPIYQRYYGSVFSLLDDQNVKSRFANTRGGERLATSIGGSVTGEGADIIIVDDAHKIDEAESDVARQAAIDFYDLVLSTRLNDQRTGALVVVGQRVHERDLSGHLLERGGYQHLCLPAEYDPAHPHLCADDPRREVGELLWPEKFGAAEIAELKETLGSARAAALLQQQPAPAGGVIFERAWWQWYDPNAPLPSFEQLAQSWDLAFSDKPSADYVVGQLWGVHNSSKYLLDVVRARLSFSDTIAAIRKFTDAANRRFPGHDGHPKLIEDAANGAAVIDTLQRELDSVIAIPPRGSKLLRAHAVAPQFEAGQVFLPGAPHPTKPGYDPTNTPAYVQVFVEELARFPQGAHDDHVDACAHALTWIAAHRGPRIRTLRGPTGYGPFNR